MHPADTFNFCLSFNPSTPAENSRGGFAGIVTNFALDKAWPSIKAFLEW
jgi:hypothetical protein